MEHYPMVFQPAFNRLLRSAPPDRVEDVVADISRKLENPLYQYRALPEALRFHRSPSQFRWCIGGNRSSKSHSVAYEVAWYATGIHPFRKIKVPNTGWYCTITWEMVGTILLEKMQEILTHTPHKIIWRSKAHGIPGVILIDVGASLPSRIIFKAYEQKRKAFQGTNRRYIANDEQFPQDIYTEQISRVGDAPLDFFTAMTPIDPQPWLEARLSADVPRNWQIFEYPLDDNRRSRGGFIPDITIDNMIDEWPEEIQPTRRRGKWASFLGAVYKTFNRNIHVVDEQKEKDLFRIDKSVGLEYGAVAVGGIDWGGSNPFVYLIATRIPHLNNAWYFLDEYYWDYRSRGVRLIRDHAREIHKLHKTWNTPIRKVWADHDAQDRMEIRACDVPTSPAKKDVLMGIETVQSALKFRKAEGRPRLFFSKRCKKTIEQMSTYKWPEGTENRDPADDPVKKDDHCPDVVRYILESERRRRAGKGVDTKHRYASRF